MKSPEKVAAEVVEQLHFSSNRMTDGRLVGEQHFAAQAIADAIKVDRMHMASRIFMSDSRKITGKGRLSYRMIIEAVNHILGKRATEPTDASN